MTGDIAAVDAAPLDAAPLAGASPLAAWSGRFAALPPGVHLHEEPFTGQLNLRTRVPGSLDAVFDEPLPGACRATRVITAAQPGSPVGRDVRVLWLGPDEWLVLTEPGDRSWVQDAIRSAGATVTDVSAQRTVLRFGGPAAREVLASGCAIDLHPAVSPQGTCVQTLVEQCGVTVVVDDDAAGAFTLLVRASFASYLAAWLIDACTEIAA